VSDSQHRAEDAVKIALNHPLLDVDYTGAKGALIQVIGGEDMKLEEINLIGSRIQSMMDPDAPIIWGARISPDFKGKIQVTTIITGAKSQYVFGSSREEKSSSEIGIEVIT
jgi:cell division protein FtsZ